MKFTKITLSVALLGALTLGMAEDTASAETTVSVDAQIEAIQAAPAQERVQLMNEFKQRLATMNEEQRTEAIAQLQEKMQTRTQTQIRAQEMAQEQQMQANEQMMQMQNMNQMQAGSQFKHMNMSGSMSGGATGSGGMNFMNH